MAYLLAFSTWAVVTSRFLVTPVLGAAWFLVALALTPRYLGVGLGNSGYALTSRRLILFSVVALGIFYAINGRRRFYRTLSPGTKNIFLLFILFAIFSCFGSVKWSFDGYFYIGFLGEILALLAGFIAGAYLAGANFEVYRFIKYLFIIPFAVNFLFVMGEVITGERFIFNFLSVDSSILFRRDFNDSYVRAGALRVTGLFNNPLLLAEFCCYFAAALLVLGVNSLVSRKILVGALVAIGIVIFCTGSRAAVGISVLTAMVIMLMHLMRGGHNLSRMMTWLLGIFGTVILVGAIWVLVDELTVLDSFYEISSEHERSNYARLLQYKVVFDNLFTYSPVIGFGYQRLWADYVAELATLDSYYLQVLLQSGFLGFLLFVIVMLLVIRLAIKYAFSNIPFIRLRGFLLLSFLLVFCLFKMFISTVDNNIYLHVMVAYTLTSIHLFQKSEIH